MHFAWHNNDTVDGKPIVWNANADCEPLLLWRAGTSEAVQDRGQDFISSLLAGRKRDRMDAGQISFHNIEMGATGQDTLMEVWETYLSVPRDFINC